MISLLRTWRASRLLRDSREDRQLMATRLLQKVTGQKADRLIVQAVGSEHEAVCLRSLELLTERRVASSLPAIFDLLVHARTAVREAAKGAIGRIDPDWATSDEANAAFKRFCDFLPNTSANVLAGTTAIDALAWIDPDAAGTVLLPLLVDCAEDTESAIRQALPPLPDYRGKAGGEALLQRCRETLATRSETWEQRRVLRLIAEIGDSSVLPWVIQCLPTLSRDSFKESLALLDRLDTHWWDSNEAEALVDIALRWLKDAPDTEPAEELLSRIRTDHCRQSCLLQLVSERLAPKAESTLERLLYEWNPNWPESEELEVALGDHLEAVGAGRVELSGAAARLLASLRQPGAMTIVLAAIDAARTRRIPDLWHAAEECMIGCEAKDSDRLLDIGLNRRLDPGVRELGIMAVVPKDHAADEVAPQLASLLHDEGEDPLLRCAAARALGRCGKHDLGCELLRFLDTKSPDHLTEASVEALGRLGYRPAVEPLLQLLQTTASQGGTRFLPILCFKTIGSLLGSEAVDRLVPFIKRQSRFIFLNPYFVDLTRKHGVRPFAAGSAINQKIELAHANWLSRVKELTNPRIIEEIHGIGRNTTDLNKLAIADWAKIILGDQERDLSRFLVEYSGQSYVRRQRGIDLDASTLAGLWGIGRYWRLNVR